ncbi:hypothetical protein HOU78_gp48 [Vibrio phage 1.204.O._10N.222.46.F12]|uniref:Uncharacterized protein n=1 Tax=Vibrio phage 1.204.O._10N.222.46.F12 TaxID=1881263 RepID=A0A2I7RNP8_9CAUD|nr:hypothetical protein HOU78_gp48 [Vibrio phage 1.204.O._10N.222.46.F12]AUR95268.1 hypothetical protein NVP1204O_48 [Vibrio phage 1.204.O._10N.222.46.F12]
MKGVRYVPNRDLQGKLSKFNNVWQAQHTAQGKRLRRIFPTQCGAILQRLQWEQEREQLKRGRKAIPPEIRRKLCSILSHI